MTSRNQPIELEKIFQNKEGTVLDGVTGEYICYFLTVRAYPLLKGHFNDIGGDFGVYPRWNEENQIQYCQPMRIVDTEIWRMYN